MTIPILVCAQDIGKTLAELQNVGKAGSECVVLWLGRRGVDSIHVEAVWKPEQESGRDFFIIPETAMEVLFRKLRSSRLMIAAQVHTHPKQAFHSSADDKWAIVRHTGALSLVIPYFALQTRLETFMRDTAVYTFSPTNDWLEAPNQRLNEFYRIVP